jgi:hypothetical protein
VPTQIELPWVSPALDLGNSSGTRQPLRHVKRSGNGAAYEAAVIAFLQGADRARRFDLFEQRPIPRRRDGKPYIADIELVGKTDSTLRGLISCKYQRATGTAEEKLYAEADHLAHVLRANGGLYRKAWLSVAGRGWSDGFCDHLAAFVADAYPCEAGRICIVDTDELFSVDFDRELA